MNLHPVKSDLAMIVFTESEDREISELSLALAKSGVRLVRVNCDDDDPIVIREIDNHGRIVTHHGMVFPKIVWTRRFWRYSGLGKVVSRNENVLAYDQAEALRRLLEEACPQTINRRLTPQSKWHQLRVAESCGFDIPASILTGDFTGIEKRLGSRMIIVKSLNDHWVRPGDDTIYGAFPVVLSANELVERCIVERVPLIVQEYLDIEAEVRVFVVGDSIIAYRTGRRRTPGSVWFDDLPLNIETYRISQELKNKVRRFASKIGLDYGALDLACCRDGRLCFLECNGSQADWRYYEKNTGDSRVRCALVDYIERLMSNV